MPRPKKPRSAITIVGPGRLGSALARSLHRAGWKIDGLVTREGSRQTRGVARLAREVGAPVFRLGEFTGSSSVVWITVPDAAIAEVAARLSRNGKWQGRTVFHSSGALTSDELELLRAKGARVASVHPGMTFVAKSAPSLRGVPFAVEGDAAAVRVARRIIADLEGKAFAIRKENKVHYHTFDTFASPLLIALMAAMEEVAGVAGIRPSQVRQLAGTLLQQTLSNYLKHGAAAAFSGAFIRGDVDTVRQHLAALRKTPVARDAYLSLAKVAVAKLPARNAVAMKKTLRRAKEKSK